MDKLDLEGRSPLHIAALSGHTEAVPFLRGFNGGCGTPRPFGPLKDELRTEVQRLLDRGADPEVPDFLEKSQRKRGSFEDFKRRYQDVIGTYIYIYK